MSREADEADKKNNEIDVLARKKVAEEAQKKADEATKKAEVEKDAKVKSQLVIKAEKDNAAAIKAAV
jgi:hypothetical protein